MSTKRPFRLIEEGTYRRQAIVFAETEDEADALRNHIDTPWKYTRLDYEVREIEPFDS